MYDSGFNRESRGFSCAFSIPARFFEARCYRRLWLDRTDLFRDDAVGPFDQRNKNGRVAELCVPNRKIVFRDPTGPGTSSSSKDRNMFGDHLVAQLAERRPT